MAQVKTYKESNLDNDWSIDIMRGQDNNTHLRNINLEPDLNIKPLSVEVTNPINYNSFTGEKFSVMYNSDGLSYQPDSDSLSIPMTADEVQAIQVKLAGFKDYGLITNGMYNYKKVLVSRADFNSINNECKFLSSGLLVKKGTFDYNNCWVSIHGYQKLIPAFNSEMGSGYKLIGSLIKPEPTNKVNMEINPIGNYLVYYIILKSYSLLFKSEKKSFMSAEGWGSINYNRQTLSQFSSFLESENSTWNSLICDALQNYSNKPTITAPLSNTMTKEDIVNNNLNYNLKTTVNGYQEISEVIANKRFVDSDTFTWSTNNAADLIDFDKVVVCKTAVYDQGYIYYVDAKDTFHKASITNFDYIPVASFNPHSTVVKQSIDVVGEVLISTDNGTLTVESFSMPVNKHLCPGKAMLSIDDGKEVYEFIIDSYYNEEYNAGTSNEHNGVNCEVVSKQVLMNSMNDWVSRRN